MAGQDRKDALALPSADHCKAELLAKADTSGLPPAQPAALETMEA